MRASTALDNISNAISRIEFLVQTKKSEHAGMMCYLNANPNSTDAEMARVYTSAAQIEIEVLSATLVDLKITESALQRARDKAAQITRQKAKEQLTA